MKWFQMSAGMRLASVWVVWVFLAVGAVGWSLFTVLQAFGVTDQASAWVQALGSIAAIFAAIAISENTHRKQIAKDERARLIAQADVAWIAECAVHQAWSELWSYIRYLDRHYAPADDVRIKRIEQSGEILRSTLFEGLPHTLVNTAFLAMNTITEVTGWATEWAGHEASENDLDQLRGYAATLNAHRTKIQEVHLALGTKARVPRTQRVVFQG